MREDMERVRVLKLEQVWSRNSIEVKTVGQEKREREWQWIKLDKQKLMYIDFIVYWKDFGEVLGSYWSFK